MQISIYVGEDSLQELSNFLKADIKYEHTIEFYLNQNIGGRPYVQVMVFYDDFLALEEWAMQSTVHPYYPKESRTNESRDL
jgi:hypothetical protein